MIVTDLSKSFHPYPKPKDRKKVLESDKKSVQKKNVEKGNIKKKSNKLAKLEKERYSILIKDFKKCYICSKKKKHIHEIYKGCNRQTSMKHGFCIPICDECHEQTERDEKLNEKLKIKCQKKFEKTHTREEFIKIIGKSYI